MARTTVKLPKMGDTTDEVVILEWLVPVGGTVMAGDVLVRVETDKVDTELPSPVGGILVEILVQVDDEVGTGAPICVIES